MKFSVIVPVFNRPDEIREFLESACRAEGATEHEFIIIEDGSTKDCASVIADFSNKLQIRYFYKSNSGPGDSRNFGMQNASGDYFLIFDSDCLLPAHYFTVVQRELNRNYVDFFGGPDAAHDSFSDVQKAINFAMTSVLTTGGIRGANANGFQPRSFNMGISRAAFAASGGFGDIHPGEDPDLVMRLWELGFRSTLIKDAFVYHKRRIDWTKFYHQVNRFGKARPILNMWHPNFNRMSFLLPSLFVGGFAVAIFAALFGVSALLALYGVYFLSIFISAWISAKEVNIALLAVVAVAVQFYGYGTGFIKSWVSLHLFDKKPVEACPELFFRSK